jgi:DNA repair protein SbcD/Mre11
MPIRIFLTADLHLDMKFPQFNEVRTLLRMARFDTLERMVRLANEHSCDLFVVAGDLFDRPSVSREVITRTTSILRGFRGRLVAVLPGNHDCASFGESELWRLFKQSISRKIVLLEKPQPYDLRSFNLDAALYPAPCLARHSSYNSIQWIREREKSRELKHHIGLAHGSLREFSADYKEQALPMVEHELLQSGLDLWLLGHNHRQYPRAGESSSKKIFYPGIPEPRGFEGTQEGKAWILEIGENKDVKETSVITGRYLFTCEEAEVSGGGLVEIKRRFSASPCNTTLLRLTLAGRLPAGDFALLKGVREEVRKNFFHLQWDQSSLEIELTMAEISRNFTEGSFPHRLLSALAAGTDFRALRLAFELMGGVTR